MASVAILVLFHVPGMYQLPFCGKPVVIHKLKTPPNYRIIKLILALKFSVIF